MTIRSLLIGPLTVGGGGQPNTIVVNLFTAMLSNFVSVPLREGTDNSANLWYSSVDTEQSYYNKYFI